MSQVRGQQIKGEGAICHRLGGSMSQMMKVPGVA